MPRARCFVLSAFLLTACTAALAHGATGEWEYSAARPDPVYGEPEALRLSLLVAGNRICGAYVSSYRGGMRVAEGTLKGGVTGATAAIVYEAGWAGVTGTGTARIRLNKGSLSWLVIAAGPEPDYMVRKAVLQRVKQQRLEAPTQCK